MSVSSTFALDDVRGPAAQPSTSPVAKAGEWLVYAPLIATTFFSKFAIPPFGARGLGIGLPLVFLSLATGLALGRVHIHPGRACFYALTVGALGILQILRQEPFSLLSFIYMAAVGLTYTLIVPRAAKQFSESVVPFSNLVAFFAICGIAQFFLQVFVGVQYAFPIENFAPTNFIVHGFNYLNALYWGSSLYKANGVFLLEPSFFSQLLAIGLLVELVTRQRASRLAILVLAMIVSYSGTGFLILAFGLPAALLANQRADLIVVFAAAVVLCAVLAVPLRLDIFLDRLGEFGTSGSSASARFVSWVSLFQQMLFNDTAHALTGYGAGAFRDVAAQVSYPVAEMLHSKIFIEYGLLGGALYIGFLLYCIVSASAPAAIKIAVVALHFMAGAYSEPVTGIALSLLLLTPPQSLRGSATQVQANADSGQRLRLRHQRSDARAVAGDAADTRP